MGLQSQVRILELAPMDDVRKVCVPAGIFTDVPRSYMIESNKED